MDTTLRRIEYLEEHAETTTTRLNVLERKLDQGFARMETRFDQLQSWLEERL